MVRWLPDGNIEYLGRIDQQIQLRGFRVELGEIELVLEQHPKIREVVVSVYEPTPGDKRLVAYVVAQRKIILNVSELLDFLKLKLPDYMLPSVFVLLDALPLTPNGKLDRKALPEPEQHRHDLGAEFIAPRSPLENQRPIGTHVSGTQPGQIHLTRDPPILSPNSRDKQAWPRKRAGRPTKIHVSSGGLSGTRTFLPRMHRTREVGL